MVHKELELIGPNELVDLPDQQLFGVPAKVDTGADSSAVWASQIREADGELSFVLFDKQSPFYSGVVVTTTKFRSTRVRNSFGHVEVRYKVSLRLKIRGRKIHAMVTLADRSANRFPILLGRRTISGKFLVDVSRTKSRLRILVLMRRITPRAQRFFEEVEKLSAGSEHYEFASYDDLLFLLTGRRTRVLLTKTEQDISKFDAVYFKDRVQDRYVAAAAATYLKERHVLFFDEWVARYPASSKLQQYMQLRDQHIAVPDSIFVAGAGERLAAAYPMIAKHLGEPFVLKDITGSNGKHNYLISSRAMFEKICQEAAETGLRLIAQKFVPNDGDYRLLVMGKRIEMVIHRRGQEGTHLNNTSKGGRATLITGNDLPPQTVCRRSVAAAELLNLSVAGVDMVQDKISGKWYCLEVNDSPQLVSGAFVAEKQAAFERFISTTVKKKGK